MKTIALVLSLWLGAVTLASGALLNVVATLPDLAAIAREVGSDKVKVTSLASGTEDPHFVDPKPSFIRMLNQADALIHGGLDLESGWLPPLLENARNAKILPQQAGHIDASQNVQRLGVPAGPVDRSQGDVHLLGNPHYLLDPMNAKAVANTLAERFAILDSPNAAFYRVQAQKFNARVEQKLDEWAGAIRPYRGTKVITYHRSFDYLLHRFGLELAGTIEPKPGIEPSPTHLRSLIQQTKEAGVKLVFAEPNRPRKTASYVADAIGAKLVVLPILVGGHERANDYVSLLDHNVREIVTALKESGAKAAQKSE